MIRMGVGLKKLSDQLDHLEEFDQLKNKISRHFSVLKSTKWIELLSHFDEKNLKLNNEIKQLQKASSQISELGKLLKNSNTVINNLLDASRKYDQGKITEQKAKHLLHQGDVIIERLNETVDSCNSVAVSRETQIFIKKIISEDITSIQKKQMRLFREVIAKLKT